MKELCRSNYDYYYPFWGKKIVKKKTINEFSNFPNFPNSASLKLDGCVTSYLIRFIW
jgi:hypothetical protein